MFYTVRSIHFQGFLVVMFLALAVSSCTPPPTAACAAKNANNNNNNNIFGIPEAKLGKAAAALQVPRGGALHEPETLADVEALVMNAAAQNQLVVIDFTASWCGPCKAIAPLYKELSDEFDDVVFLKVDVDENPETAGKYSVSAMPTFVFIKGGVVEDRLMGANPAKLRELIEEHM